VRAPLKEGRGNSRPGLGQSCLVSFIARNPQPAAFIFVAQCTTKVDQSIWVIENVTGKTLCKDGQDLEGHLCQCRTASWVGKLAAMWCLTYLRMVSEGFVDICITTAAAIPSIANLIPVEITFTLAFRYDSQPSRMGRPYLSSSTCFRKSRQQSVHVRALWSHHE
jgi:hypothetical protein